MMLRLKNTCSDKIKRDACAEIFPLKVQSTQPLFISTTAPLITVSSLISLKETCRMTQPRFTTGARHFGASPKG